MATNSPRLDVALVSCQTLPEPDPDAAPLAQALAAAGLCAEVRAWEDSQLDWAEARLTVLRSTWNYPWHHQSFLAWAAEVDRVSTLLNPLAVICWNTHKSYLLELERAGIPIAPTELVMRDSTGSLATILDERAWSEVVIKPAVSAGSYRTLRIGRGELEQGQAHLRALLNDGDALVQRYLPSVEDYGERALVVIDGELTHAVRKSPRFVGDEEEISAEALPVSEAERRLAEAVLAHVTSGLLYARVDVAPGLGGTPVVMELELVEPSLFFDRQPKALDRFVSGLKKRL